MDAGFDIGKPALFLWEGVMMYLDREAVESTLAKIAGTARGSIVAFDYFTTETIESKALLALCESDDQSRRRTAEVRNR